MARMDRTTRYWPALKALLAGKSRLLIVLQDNPDPDAIASAAALRALSHHITENIQCSLACGGTVGRAENRALVRYMGLNIRPAGRVDAGSFDLLALVDTQPGHGNTSLPEGAAIDAVIDHHPLRDETRSAAFRDVRRRYGATSTILFEYLKRAGVEPDAVLATALVYGIRSDTQDLGRDTSAADVRAYETLYPLANKRMLAVIQRGQVPTDYFRMLSRALGNAHLCGRCIFSRFERIENADMVAEVADLMLRHEEADCSLCWGYFADKALLSVRSRVSDLHADVVVRKIVSRKGVGGGHHAMAGGQISMVGASQADRKRLDTLVQRRFLKATGNAASKPLRLL
jgi:nanoRNase/pAp phosphatase (c-di-AMP/oligoRNAs hydrolase)